MEKIYIENQRRHKKLIPFFLAFFFVTLFFSLALIYPYQIDVDTAFQLKSVQQFRRGEANLFNSVSLPSPKDLSQDVQTWIVYWPPGIPAFFLPLLMLGIPLGIAARLISYGFFLLGCLGWIKLAYRIQSKYTVILIFSLILPLYFITIAGVTELVGDVFPFGIMPWLFLYTLHITDTYLSNYRTYRYILMHSIFLCFFLGSICWLKYSAFTASISLFVYLIICFLFFRSQHLTLPKRKFLLAVVSIFFFSLPPITLILVNRVFVEITHLVSQSKAFFISHLGEGFNPLLFFMGALGIALFQADFWLRHIICFSDKWFPLFSNLNFAERTIPLVIAGIPGTIFVVWLLFYAKKIYERKITIFIFCTALIPFIIRGYLNYMLGGFLIDSRYASSHLVFTEIILLSVFYSLYQSSKKYIFYSLLFPFFILPNLFVLGDFFKNKIIERMGHKYITTENRIYVPTLSEVSVKSAVDRINSLIKSPRDIVVLALHSSLGSASGAWLEMKQRTLPLCYYWTPLLHTHGSATNVYGSSKFITSKPLRVVLVVSKGLEKNKEFPMKLKQRFPQAKEWNSLQESPGSDALVSIYFSDLRAP